MSSRTQVQRFSSEQRKDGQRIRKLADDPLQVLATLYCMFATLPFRE